jgi:ATP-binding cassette subfamily B (MDR/TAP) protein 1
VFTFAGPLEFTMIGVAGVAALASGVGIASQNIIFGQFVTAFTEFGSGEAAADNFRNSGQTLALYFFFLGVGRLVMAYIYNALLTYSAYRIVRNVRHAYLKAALRQEVAYYDLGNSGSIATQAYSSGRLIQAGVSEKLGLTVQGLSAFLSSFIIAFVTNWKLTLIICAIAPLTVAVMIGCAFIEAGYEAKILEYYALANAFAEGVLSSIRTVHAFEIRSRLVDRFDLYLTKAHWWGNKISLLFGILFSAEYTIIYLGNALAFWRGIRMLANGEIAETGDVFTVLLSVVIAALSITQLAPYSIEFTRAASAAAQLFILIDRQTAIDPFDASGEQPASLIGDVELEGITFSYPTRPNVTVLDNFSLQAPAGKVTALVGQSGSGKSTIVGLLERWYNPTSGAIKLDGRPIDSLNLAWLRRNIRLVQQEPVLFRGSVFDNIAHGLVGTPLEKTSKEEQMIHVVEAAKIAYADDFISQLPNGYDTEIGQRGGLLSGGQKQRVAIARSLVSNPKVLLLDEATSALDPYAEGIVQQALDSASAGRTTIVIAHKLATIRNADKIIVMSKGKIIEQGTHDGLIAMNGTYSRLVTIQQLTVSNESTPEGSEIGKSSLDEGTHELKASKSLTRHATADQANIGVEPGSQRYNDQNFQQLGLLAVIWRLVVENPDLKWAYIALVTGCILSAGLFPSQAILMAYIVEVFTLTGSEMTERGDFFSAMFVALAGAALFGYYVMGWGTNTLAQTLAHNLRKQIFNDILRQDLEYFDRPENNIGALASRIDAYPQAVFELMGFNVGFILIASFSIAACSVLGIVYAWKLGMVIVFAGIPALLGCGYIKMRLDGRLDRMVAKRLATSSAIASESTTAIRTVSSLGIENSILDRYIYELDHAVNRSLKPLLHVMVWFALTQASEYWFQALGFWYGTRLVSFGEITLFEFFVSYMSVFFCAQSTAQIFGFSTSITKGRNGANAIFWLRQLQPTVQETLENKDNAPRSGGSIQLSSAQFAYPLRPHAPILKGIDLEAAKGKFIALVGASGCGKSTIIAMLERFYDPTGGHILIGGDDLTTLNPRKYRSQVGLVQQEPTLFQGTIRENIALGMDISGSNMMLEISDTDMEKALRAANAWDFVSSLPEGINTAAGPNGTQLSGGQRQRIAIARALVRNPRILLLDEATSALDTESEKIVQNALSEAAKEGDRITIAVAHRLSTIKDADMICVFYGGRIVEQGTHAELLNGDGALYKKMCEAQSLS